MFYTRPIIMPIGLFQHTAIANEKLIQVICSLFILRYRIRFVFDLPFLQRTMKHLKFISRTVLVRNENVDEACRMLNRIMGSEGFLDQYRRTRFYEKPTQMRRRINYEKCKAIYDEDMKRKINFILRKNRPEPFPGCYQMYALYTKYYNLGI